MSKTKINQKTISRISAVFIIAMICSVGYYFYPSVMKNLQKQNVIEVAQGTTEMDATAIDFEGLRIMNPDTVGWVLIEGTPLNYPVVQTDNNDYYLSHNFERNAAIEGTVFLDYVCPSENTRNNILYGHYMQDESMFGVLWQYQNEAYFKVHPIIQYDRPGNPGKWEIFSVYITEADYDYRRPEFTDNTEFINYMNRVKKRSLYDTGVVLSPTDEVLTLSTCIYTFDDARLAIHARKITQ
ncbi:class B sortase [Acetobacterium bakii]|uniref:class B sortase n=1 Tax=Acetobacterium bakii TaxID=52689 RepID=UPI000681E2BB|nr:class B sortase [Acetobacterium bakii]